MYDNYQVIQLLQNISGKMDTLIDLVRETSRYDTIMMCFTFGILSFLIIKAWCKK